MSTAAQISLGEYLSSEYEPDCDYVDGVLEDRNAGKTRHSRTQTLLAGWLLTREKEHGYKVLTEERVRVSSSRVRIPDICLVDRNATEEVLERPPVLWIEILSPDDRWSRIQRRLADCISFGVQMIWILDPYLKEAWSMTPHGGTVAVTDGILRYPELGLEVPLEDILPED
jgi:Uma2 family endonuclease